MRSLRSGKQRITTTQDDAVHSLTVNRLRRGTDELVTSFDSASVMLPNRKDVPKDVGIVSVKPLSLYLSD